MMRWDLKRALNVQMTSNFYGDSDIKVIVQATELWGVLSFPHTASAF